MSADSLKTNDTRTEIKHFAECLSEMLTSPNLPVNIYNGFKHALDDAFNRLPGDFNEELSAYQDSPEQIEKLLSAFTNK